MKPLKDYEKAYQEYWLELVGLDLNDHEQVKKELYDFYILIKNVPIVYDHVTGGRISKHLTDPHVVCSIADEHYGELYEQEDEDE